MKFSEKLRALRKERGVTQRDVAKATGLSASVIAFYETGGRTPSFDAAEAIADYFKIPLSEMVGGKDELPVPAGVIVEETPADELCQIKIRIGTMTIIVTGTGVIDVDYKKSGSEGSFRL